MAEAATCDTDLSDTGGQDYSSTGESVENPTADEVNISWDEECYRPTDFTDPDQLPRVVRLEEDGPGQLSPGLRIYTRQPVLMSRTAEKEDVSARTIYRDKSNGTYFEVGQTLLIPVSYDGWFEKVPPSFGRAEYYRTIAEVAKVMPKRFFTRQSLNVLVVTKKKGGEESYSDRKIPAASILRTETVFTARWKTKTQSGLLKPKEKEVLTREVRYLQCVTVDKRQVLLLLEHPGRFSAIYEGDRKSENLNAIYRIKDLVSDFKLPVMVRLLYGKAPVVPCIFTGLLVLKSSEKRRTLIGSTILNKRNVLFELPTDAPCNLQLAKNEEEIDSMDTYKDAKHLCKKYASSYAAMIKLSSAMDTNLEVLEHKPASKRKSRADESLKTLDLIKDVTVTDFPTDSFLESESDTSSQTEIKSGLPEDGMVLELVKDADVKGDSKC